MWFRKTPKNIKKKNFFLNLLIKLFRIKLLSIRKSELFIMKTAAADFFPLLIVNF